ncbi:MAG: hypothetical protein JOY69_07540 [Candidatus Eremiobacteraeota bacterium]|nr:hypothetical protein [Candidatus Eremiobacteraeota bacterium]
MPEEFVSLDAFFRRAEVVETAREPIPPTASQGAVNDEPAGQARAACVEVIAAARRFHAALADAAEASLDRLLRTLARDVLGRELALAPAEITSLVCAALERFANEDVLRVRANADETAVLEALGIPVQSDPQLIRGDFILELQSGTIVATLRSRLDWALESTTGS